MSVSDGGDSFISFLAVAAAWQRLIQSGQSVSIGKGGMPDLVGCPLRRSCRFASHRIRDRR